MCILASCSCHTCTKTIPNTPTPICISDEFKYVNHARLTAEEAVADLKKEADETAEVADEFKRYYMPAVVSQSVSVFRNERLC